jgi:hypothetical protein
VLRDAGDAAGSDPPRAPWQWVFFGALGIFVVWVPLAALTTAAIVRAGALEQAPLVRAALFAGGLGAAGFAGGYLVGRWGGPGVGTREAALAGLAAAAMATALAWGGGGAIIGALATAAVAVPAAALGGRFGLRRRTPGV